MKKENLLGQKFTRLTVIAETEPVGKRQRTAWLCKCECGNEKIVKADELKSGDTKSCGCWNQEKRKERASVLYGPCIKYHPGETSARRVWLKRYNDGGITYDDFFRLSQENCHYCGDKPNNLANAAKEDPKSSQFARDNGDFIYNGLDRIDSSLTHTLENVVPCCKWCNLAKRERSITDFENWVEQTYLHIQKRKSS